jgi:hypothetical protein
MTGGLLQLVAVGIDSIFLTSNPSITLFKVVYRRYTNFSLTTRTKQIKNITDFDIAGHYTLQKEADCIHKIWLNFDISDIELSYGNPTKEYINEICSKYGFQIEYDVDMSGNIVTPNDYNYIINEINQFIESEVDKNNFLIDVINLDKNYWVDTTIITQKNNIIDVFKLKLDQLISSYEAEVFDASGNIILSTSTLIFLKLICIKLVFSQQNLINDNTEIIQSDLFTNLNYVYLDSGYYDHPEYSIGMLNGSPYGDKLNNTYIFTKNRSQETYINQQNITSFIYFNLDVYLRDLLLMYNNKNLFLYNSPENNLQNIKSYNDKIYNIIFTIKDNLNSIIQGYNPNNIKFNFFGSIYNILSYVINLNIKITEIINQLQNQIFLKIQYKNLIDFVYFQQLYTYNQLYNKFFINDIFINTLYLTLDLLDSAGDLIRYYYTLSNYIFNMIIDAHINNTLYNALFYHIENKINYEIFSLEITNDNINYKIYSEYLLRNLMMDLANNKVTDSDLYNIKEINDLMYNEYIKELTYDLVGTIMYTPSGNKTYFFPWVADIENPSGTTFSQITSIDPDGFFYGVMQNLYSCFILLHIIESNMPNNLNYSDGSGNYMGNLSNQSKYYGYKMIDYFNAIIESQNNPLIPVLNFNSNSLSAILYTDLDTYKILQRFLSDSDIIYSENSFSQNFTNQIIQTLHQNQYANIDILYTIILNCMISASHHHYIKVPLNPNLTKQQQLLDAFYNMQTDYYKYIYYKTFTNNISDTNKFTTLINSPINELNDNIIKLFTKYTQNNNLYEIYFVTDIINRITKLNYNIQILYENTFFADYFNDINLWTKLLLNSDQTRNILQNLTFDLQTGDIIPVRYYFDASGMLHAYSSYQVDPTKNIFDKFIAPLSDLVKNNIIFLNYTPLHLIRDIFDDIYIMMKNYKYTYTLNNIVYSSNLATEDLYNFDFRDLQEYDSLSINDLTAYEIINNNILFKNDLYQQVIMNIILKLNNNNNVEYNDASGLYMATDFADLVFNQNLLKVADFEYLTTYADNFLQSNRTGLVSLLRPENLIDINNNFITRSDSSGGISVYDNSGNLIGYQVGGFFYKYELLTEPEFNDIEYDSSGNPISNITNKPLYVPFIRGIIERIRIQLLQMIWTDKLTLTGFPSYLRQAIYNDIITNYINPLLENYYKFDDVDNINNDKYSYSSFKNQGNNFNISKITNNVINTSNFIRGPSSIWSYLNKMQIREYNAMFNDTLLSLDYYGKYLGAFMRDAYQEVKWRLTQLYHVQPNYPMLPTFYQNGYSKYYYSYALIVATNDSTNIETIDLYERFNIVDPNTGMLNPNPNNLTYPVSTYGFDYYSLGDVFTFVHDASGYHYNILTIDLTSLYYPTQTKRLIDWYYTINSLLLSIDTKKCTFPTNGVSGTPPPYYFYLLYEGMQYNVESNEGYNNYILNNYPDTYTIDIAQYLPYYSNLMRIRNKTYDETIAKKTLSEIIDYFNDYVNGEYLYYSDVEKQIANRVKQNLVNKYWSNKNSINYLEGFINFIYTQNYNVFNSLNINFQHMINIDSSNNITNIPSPYYYYNNSRLFYDNIYYGLSSTFKQNILAYINSIFQNLIDKLNQIIGQEYFNGFNKMSDIVKFMIYLINIDTLNDLELSQIINVISANIEQYDNLLKTYYDAEKLNLFNTIKNMTIPRISDIIIDNNTKIKFSYDLPYIDLLYHIPDYYTQTDILYYGSDLDTWLRNVIYKNPVKYCWVSELGYYLLEYYNFYLDELLIDSYNSNLLSLLDKINGIRDYKSGIDKLNGNTIYNTTYDTNKKGNLHLKIPLKFYFCKEIFLSIPMINLLYTKGMIKFKTRKLEDLLIYDKNAIIIKKPKLKCSATIQYIYLEEEERKRISKSKIEFLIEKFRYCGIYKYNITNIIDGKIKTQLRIADPTKYILWRMKITYQDNMKNNFTWNKNGYLDENYNPIKTTDSIKVYFNGSTREQGDSELFSLINPHMRCVGSLEEDEYMYIFALYPLLYQPSGTANMTNMEEVIIEHQLNSNFLTDLQNKKLNFEIEYWAFGYNVLRFMSGMCAPIFYI